MSEQQLLDVQSAARTYLAAGLDVIPLGTASKVPMTADGQPMRNWTTYRVTPDRIAHDFAGAATNIGIRWSDKSAEVDLDCSEAIALASVFLDPTKTYGRATAPRSHWVYACNGARTRKFESHKSMVLELRAGSGHQTMAPPSVHPSGEPVDWTDKAVLPAITDAKELERRCALLAASVLVLRHWEQGKRDELAVAYTRVLIEHCDVGSGRADEIVTAIAVAAGDMENRRKGAKVKAALDAGGLKYGIPTLRKHLGEDAALVLEWLGVQSGVDDFDPDAYVWPQIDDPDVAADLPPFPAGLLPADLEPLAQAVMRQMHVPYGATVTAALVAMAAAVGPNVTIKLGEHFERNLNLMGLLVGDSSWGKSPVFDTFMSPAAVLNEFIVEENKKRQLVYEKAQVVYKAKKRAYDEQLAEAVRENKLEAFGEMPPSAPPPYRQIRLKLDGDQTPAKLAETMEPRALGTAWLLHDAGPLFSRLSRDGLSEMHDLLMAAGDNNSYEQGRVTEGRTRYLPRAYLNLIGGLQSGVIASSLPDEVQALGFVSRFQLLFHYPREREHVTAVSLNEVNDAAMIPYHKRFCATFNTFYGEHESRVLKLAPDAQAFYEQCKADLHNASMKEQGPMMSHVKKLDILLARLAAFMHILDARIVADHRDGEPQISEPDYMVDVGTQISLNCVQRAWVLVELYKEHARAVYGAASRMGEQVRKLAAWIKRPRKNGGRWNSFTTTEAVQYCGFGDQFKVKAQQCEELLRMLQDRGIVYAVQGKRGGYRWHTNPAFLGQG